MKIRSIAVLLVLFMVVISGCQRIPGFVQESIESISPTASTATTVSIALPDAAASIDNDLEIQYIYHMGNAKFAPSLLKKSLKALEADTVAVVKATPIESKPNPDLDPMDHITLTTIRIDDVLQPDGIVKNGATYTLVEYYRKQQDPDNKSIIHVFSTNDSFPLRLNQQYLIFLDKSPQDFADYSVAGAWQGRFPLNEKTTKSKMSDLTAEDMEFPEEKANDQLWSLAAEAFKKYITPAK